MSIPRRVLCAATLALLVRFRPFIYRLYLQNKPPPLHPFSRLLHQLQRREIARVWLAPNSCIVEGKSPGTLYRYLALTYRMLRNAFPLQETDGLLKDANERKSGILNWLKPKPETTTSPRKLTFCDVAGIDTARKQLEDILDVLHHPLAYVKMGARLPKGVLLSGPSGSGKTLLARVLASEAQIPFLYVSASEFVETFVGRGAKRVRDLFTQARRYPKCIIFIDEVDALGKSRGGLNACEEREQTLNQLLIEMDGFEPGQNLMILAATNRPEVLDPALCRPGRLDRHIRVPHPDSDGRLAILKVHAGRVHVHPDVDLTHIVAMCAEFNVVSGAQLANIVNEAALVAVRQGNEEIQTHHFRIALTETQNHNVISVPLFM